MAKIFAFLFQFLPLSAFAVFAFWDGEPSPERFRDAYLLGGFLAITQFAYYLVRRRIQSRLVLAANLYLIVGLIASTLDIQQIFTAYEAMRESAIFSFMLVVGVATTFANSNGYIGVKSHEKALIRKYSLILLVLTAGALAVSFAMKGDRLFAGVIPVIALAVASRFLGSRIKQTSGDADLARFVIRSSERDL